MEHWDKNRFIILIMQQVKRFSERETLSFKCRPIEKIRQE